MKQILFTFLFFQSIGCFGQSNIYFNKEIDNQNVFQDAQSIITTPDSGSIAVGSTWFNPEYNKAIIIKHDKNGLEIWRKSYGDSLKVYGLFNILPTSNSNYTVSGVSRDSFSFYADNRFDIAKINSSGDTLSRNQYAIDSFADGCAKMIRTSDGGYAVVGWSFKYPNGIERFLFLKTDSLGNQQILKRYTIDSTRVNRCLSVVEMPDKGFLLIGFWTAPPSTNSFERLIMRIDSAGNFQWYKKYTSPWLDTYSDGLISGNDTILLAGYKTVQGVGPAALTSPLIDAIDFNGNLLWERTYINDSSNRGNFNRMIKTNDGNFALTGISEPKDSTHSFAFIMKINSIGDSIWLRNYRRSYNDFFDDYLYDLKQTWDNGYILCGTVYDTITKQDIWLLKVDCMGCDTPGCPGYDACVVADTTGNTNQIYWNLENKIRAFPNPFNTEINFSYTLSKSGETEFHLYNLLGHELKTKKLKSQFGNFIIDANLLASGVYVYSLTQNEKVLLRGKVVKQ